MAESTATKVCTKCKQECPTDAFPKDSSTRDKLARWCKSCNNANRRANYWKNRERELAKNRKWSAENAERHKALRDAWYEANRERASATRLAWAKANADRQRQTRAEWLAKNPDYYRGWDAANADKNRQYQRRYRLANLDKFAEQSRRRRAAVVGEVDLDALWTGDCALCGDAIDSQLRWPDPMSKSVDHIFPVSKGGAHVQANLQWAHLLCNLRKGDRTA